MTFPYWLMTKDETHGVELGLSLSLSLSLSLTHSFLSTHFLTNRVSRSTAHRMTRNWKPTPQPKCLAFMTSQIDRTVLTNGACLPASPPGPGSRFWSLRDVTSSGPRYFG
uniref:Uncharacterized protein n=1 Tax=Anguilla anguilla TaxID=7936 RepID=A0A0E9WYE7_ANGAN